MHSYRKNVLVRAVDRNAHIIDVLVRFVVETVCEYAHYEYIDDERHEQSDGRLYEEVQIRLPHLIALTPIHFATLKSIIMRIFVKR